MIPTTRQTNLVIFLGCTLLILIALYMQHIMGLVPCYLCVTQRVFVIATGLIALLAFLHHRHTRFYGAITALSALAGGFFSGKQLWLQHLPEERVPACGPPVEYLFDVFNFSDALGMLLRGDGNCAEVQWLFLGLSIPGWTLVCFILLAALGLWQMVRRQ
ncbi:MAG: disulfide bond formation protein DsbB [Porticoccus sp.]|jgi:disulfide bond formation protein DsbB|uniref:disulfide bond formation protein B n=1 Tax=Porticoccus sp. TaxID=2024853 RepID=UPI0039E546EC